LRERGFLVEVETSERLLEAGISQGQTSAEIRADPVQWQQRIFTEDHRLFDSLPTDSLVFTDTSFIEDVVFGRRAGMAVGPNLESWLRTKRYKKVFFLDPLQSYEQSQVRMESHAVASQISDQVRECYREYGYEPVVVPSAPVGERLALILAHVEGG
jgi:predicted ATPase